jgi:hypothetical protein
LLTRQDKQAKFRLALWLLVRMGQRSQKLRTAENETTIRLPMPKFWRYGRLESLLALGT